MGDSPDMMFYPAETSGALSLSYTGATTLEMPTWNNGARYSIYVKAQNVGDQWLDTGSDGHVFVYDDTPPTVTGHDSLLGLSEVEGTPSALASYTESSGTVTDNVSDVLDTRQVYMRIQDTLTSKYLNPSTLINFDVTDGDAAWALSEGTGDDWSFGLGSAKFVVGNTVRVEVYAADGAGNQHTAGGGCPWSNGDAASKCLTGSASDPKYVRYFKLDNKVPTLSITTPTVTVPNNIGGADTLTAITGLATDLGYGTEYVEYALRYDEDEPARRWEADPLDDVGEWKTGETSDLWNVAGTTMSTPSLWMVWQASHIAWVESEGYVFKVRGVDSAGNVSAEKSITFNYDVSEPESVVTVPAPGTYGSRVATISGTVVDETSTGTPSGLDSEFHVSVQRQSDSYWWDYASSTWSGTSVDATLTIGAGLGEKNWELPLHTSFYDLLDETDETFLVYSWAKDKVNNPAATNNAESSSDLKLTFSYEASTPTLVSISPDVAEARDFVGSVDIVLDANGAGLRQAWVVFIDTDNYYWQGSSWSTVAHSTDVGSVWLTTDTLVGGSPDMMFYPTDTGSSIQLSFTPNTTFQVPAFNDGARYRIYVQAKNSAGQVLDTSEDGHVFIYDASTPTLTGYGSIVDLSEAEGTPTTVASYTESSGTIVDNVSDSLDERLVYFRIQDRVTSKYLNPSTLINFDINDGDSAWSEFGTTGDDWSYGLA
ncbi:MAG: hypothetical protein ACYTFG_19945, partial [Planctomycetota bacterium]